MSDRGQPATRGDVEDAVAAVAAHFDGKLDAQAAHFDGKLDALTTRVDEKLDAQAAHFDEKLDALTTRVDEKLDAQAAHFDEKLDALATRADEKLDALALQIGEAAAHTANVVIEHNREMFRLATDQTKAVDDKLATHVADDGRHRVARRRR